MSIVKFIFFSILVNPSRTDIIFFEGSMKDSTRSSITEPSTTRAPVPEVCKLVEDCPYLAGISNEDLSRIRPCRFEENRAYYPCVSPKPSTTARPKNRKKASISECNNCILGTECPETNSLLLDKNFEELRNSYKLCGFRGRDPKFCCPIHEEEDGGALRDGSQEEFMDYNLRDFDFESIRPNKKSEENNLRFAGEEGSDLGCGFAPPVRIIGGRDAGIHEFPWNVALVYKNDSMSKVLCGGVIISSTEALTAGHCIRNINGFLLTSILVGHSDLNETTEVNLTAVTLHPAYSRKPFIVNDLAILHFNSLDLSREEVSSVCLPFKGKYDRHDDSAVVSGWGVTKFALFPDYLQVLPVSIVSVEACEAQYAPKHPGIQLDGSQICATGVKEKTDSCSGDSGSPLLYYESAEGRAVLLGITSFGTRKCDSSIPGVYTLVSSYIPWIREAVVRARKILDN